MTKELMLFDKLTRERVSIGYKKAVSMNYRVVYIRGGNIYTFSSGKETLIGKSSRPIKVNVKCIKL